MKTTNSLPIVHSSNKFIPFLIGLLIAGSLININTFGPTTLFAYFSYTIVGSIIAGIGLILNKQPIQIANPLPLILLTLLAGYYFFNGLVNGNGGINLRHYIILVDAVLLISFCALLSKGVINLLSVSKIITIISIIESLICILQQFGIIPSLDTLFKVTGSNENPNVTAMFLAMAMPAILLVFFHYNKNYPLLTFRSSFPLSLYPLFLLASIILCLFALGFLQCRTAFIGTAVSVTLIINHQFQLLHKLQTKFSKSVLIIIAAITLCLTAIALNLLIHHKQASSDGRLFIWKISLQAIAQKPILGSGYGQFEHDYNLAQAKYFATKAATQQEIMNASYVHMSYNEFLENLFEGGIIGLVLFIGLLLALLLGSTSLRGTKQPNAPTPTTLHNTPLGDVGLNGGMFFAYAGIATFTTMCLFNFTVQAIPVRALFILYAAICCVVSRHREAQGSLALSGSFFRIKAQVIAFSYGTPFRVGVSILSVFLLLKLLPLSKAYHQCEIIVETSDDLGENEAGDELAALQNKMDKSTYYWRNYGDILYKASKNAEAVEKLQHATAFSSNPNIYLEVGNCYSRMGKFQKAITAITVSKNIQPHLFAPPLRTYESVWLCKRHRKHTVHGKRNNGLAAQDCIR